MRFSRLIVVFTLIAPLPQARAQYSIYGTGAGSAADCPQPRWIGPEEEDALEDYENAKDEKEDLDLRGKRTSLRDAEKAYNEKKKKYGSTSSALIRFIENHVSQGNSCEDYQAICGVGSEGSSSSTRTTVSTEENSLENPQYARQPAQLAVGAQTSEANKPPAPSVKPANKPPNRPRTPAPRARQPTPPVAEKPVSATPIPPCGPTVTVACICSVSNTQVANGQACGPAEAEKCKPRLQVDLPFKTTQGGSSNVDPKFRAQSEAFKNACNGGTINYAELCKGLSGTSSSCSQDLADLQSEFSKYNDAKKAYETALAKDKESKDELKKLRKAVTKAKRNDQRELNKDPDYETEGTYCVSCNSKFQRQYGTALNVAGNVALGIAGMSIYRGAEKYRVNTNAKLGFESESSPALFAGFPYFANALRTGLGYYGGATGGNLLCSGSAGGGGAYGPNGLYNPSAYGSLNTPWGVPSWLTQNGLNPALSMYMPGYNPLMTNPLAAANPLLAGNLLANPYALTNPLGQLGLAGNLAGLYNPYGSMYPNLGATSPLGLGTNLVDPSIQAQLLQQQAALQQQAIQAQQSAYQQAIQRQAAVAQQTQAINSQIAQLMQQLATIQTTGYLGGVYNTGTTGLNYLGTTAGTLNSVGTGVSSSTAPR